MFDTHRCRRPSRRPRAIALARQLAAPEAKLTFAHVYGGHTMGGRASAMAVPLELEAGEQILARALKDSKVKAETELVYSSSVDRGLHELVDQLGTRPSRPYG